MWTFVSSARVAPALSTCLALLGGVCLAATPAAAEDWPFFRGPDGNGVSQETGWQTHWPEEGPPIAWRANVGVGASSFVTSGERVVTMGNRNDTDVVACFDAESGRVLWRFQYPARFDQRQFEGGSASTPTIDGGRVYTLSYDGQLHCLDLESGDLLWRWHLVEDFGGRLSRWKYAGSPLVVGGRVIVDAGGRGTSTVALDKRSGEPMWTAGGDRAGYATPIPFEQDGTDGVLVFKAGAMVAHALSDGRELWRIPWRTSHDVNASSPIAMDDRILISSGYPQTGRASLFRLTSGGPQQVWENRDIKTRMNSCVVYDGHVYAVTEARRGQLLCVELETGRTVWQESAGIGQHGTLKIAGGKLLILSEGGELIVARPTPEGYDEISRAQVLEGRCWVMPVLSHGRIFARNNVGDVVCVDVRGAAAR